MKRAILLLVAITACDSGAAEGDLAAQRVEPPSQQGAAALPADVRHAPDLPARFGDIGQPASRSDIRLLDIDVNPAGVGLPPGRGTYARGAEVYAQQCASCHGAKGEGVPPGPRLVKVSAVSDSTWFARDTKQVKTIGNYWPYATTLYDYINRAMPFATPGTLPPGDVYSVVAWLLVENGIIDRGMTIDAKTLPKVRMPARDRFVRDDRIGGAGFR